MLLTVLAALAQDPPPEGPADRPEDLASSMPVQPVSSGAYQVLVKTREGLLPQVRVGGQAVPLADDGAGPDAVAGDGIHSGEVPAPRETGSIVVLVEGEEAFSDQVPLNAGERVRVVMTERGPMLSFEPAEPDEASPGEAAVTQGAPPKFEAPEGAGSGSLAQFGLAAGAALVFGVLLGGWLGPNILGRRGARPTDRAGLALDGRTLWSCEDRPGVEALLSGTGQTLLVRGPIDHDGLLDAAEDHPGAVVLARLEELEGDLAEVLKEAPSNLLLLAEGQHPQASGTLRVSDGRLEAG